MISSSHWKGAHGHFIFLSHIRQGQLSVDRETLLDRMAAEQLEFRSDDALLGQIGDELVSEQMGVYPLLDASSPGIVCHDLPDAPGGVRPVTIGFEEIHHALQALPFDVLGELSPKAGGKEHIPIFVPLPLANAELAGVEIDVCQAELDQFGIPDPGKQEQFEHHQVRELARPSDL
jgi:hypothetical protein